MTEKLFQTRFYKWLTEMWPKIGEGKTAFFELKLVKQKKLYYQYLPEHQRIALSRPHVFKMPDCGFRNPCDCYYKGYDAQGYLVVRFYKIGITKFYMIPIEKILNHIKSGDSGLDEITAGHMGKAYYL